MTFIPLNKKNNILKSIQCILRKGDMVFIGKTKTLLKKINEGMKDRKKRISISANVVISFWILTLTLNMRPKGLNGVA